MFVSLSLAIRVEFIILRRPFMVKRMEESFHADIHSVSGLFVIKIRLKAISFDGVCPTISLQINITSAGWTVASTILCAMVFWRHLMTQRKLPICHILVVLFERMVFVNKLPELPTASSQSLSHLLKFNRHFDRSISRAYAPKHFPSVASVMWLVEFQPNEHFNTDSLSRQSPNAWMIDINLVKSHFAQWKIYEFISEILIGQMRTIHKRLELTIPLITFRIEVAQFRGIKCWFDLFS